MTDKWLYLYMPCDMVLSCEINQIGAIQVCSNITFDLYAGQWPNMNLFWGVQLICLAT